MSITKRPLGTLQILFVVNVLLIAVIQLSACGQLPASSTPETIQRNAATSTPMPPPTIPPTPAEVATRGTVSIWHSWDETEIPALVQITASFKELYPDVYFDVLYVPIADLKARFEEAGREGSGPTLLLGPAEWGPSLYGAGLITDLTTLASNNLLASLNQPALGAAQYQNAWIGLPYSIEGVVLYRNKDIITISPDTFDELITLADSSTLGENVGAMLERSLFYSGAHLDGIGGTLMDPNGLPGFNTSAGLEWLELLRAFELAGPTDYFTDQDLVYFKEGRIGWIIDGTWNRHNLAEAIGYEKLAIDAWPSYKDKHLSGYVMAENLYISRQAVGDHLMATQKFLQHFLSVESQTRLAEVGRIPAATHVEFPDPVTGPLVNQAISALSKGTTYPILPYMEIYNITMDIALRAFFEGGVPAEEVLQNAHDEILVEILSSQETSTPTP